MKKEIITHEVSQKIQGIMGFSKHLYRDEKNWGQF